uniref:Small nuclear RNA activating complex, polypeptide 4 n=1 Tax=Xiphophorus couchianus TaxID=32473 RepID=A0A3B5LZY3_9TELE
ADLLAQKQKIQSEIQNLEDMLGPHSESLDVSSEDMSSRRSCPQTEPDLSPSASSCLQLNLVYQQVVQETLDQLEALLAHNRRQQVRTRFRPGSGLVVTLCGSGPRSRTDPNCTKMFLGSFLKPYFKDRLTGLGPPANQEVKLKAQRMMGCPEDKKLKLKRWESWQKTLLVHSVTRDHLKRLMLPKLSRLDFLTSKFSSAQGADRQEEELTGDRYEEHDWQKISNIDFEGTKDAEDIRLFWQNVLHPSINKTAWSSEEVQRLSAICRRHEDRHWDSIAQELGTGRTAFMCLQMFQRFVSDSLKRSSWTAEEDEQLRELVQKMRIGNFIPYTQISYFMEGRDPTQLVYRLICPSACLSVQLLLQAVARHGEKCWWKVRLEVPGRTDGACRDRYLDCLKKNIKKGPFERHEVELLEQLVKKHGVGRWAKIAAEIPHRLDAQCLREWRKLTCKKGGRGRGRGRGAGGFNVSIRRGILKMKEEEEVQVTEDEDEDEVVQYMDSDEDCNKKRKRSMEEEEEEEEEYILPPMEEWLPAEVKQSSTSLSFTLVELPSSGEAPDRTAVRSTVLGRPGPSVVIGAPPRELSWEERRSSSAVPMASREALRLHLSALKQKVGSAPQPGRRPRPQAQELRYELQVAVTPWIGNLLIPKSQKRSAADALREAGERSGVSTSSAFTLLLQAMNVDTLGCRQMIEERKSKADLQAPPHARGPKRVSELLANRRSQEEEDQRRVLLLVLLKEPGRTGRTKGTWFWLVGLDLRLFWFCFQATKKRSSASSKQKRVGRAQSKESSAMEAPPHSQAPPLSQVTGLHFLPNRSIWVMTPGSVPVAQAPPPALQVGLLPRGPPLISEAPPPLTAGLSSVTPADPRDLQLLPVPTCRFKPLLPAVIQSPDLRPTGWPRPHLLLAYQGAAGRQTVGPTGPPLPTAGLHFDPTLMCLEPPEEVHDWLRGRGGVVVPGARCALPYLPPSVSSLSALSGLLRAKASVTASEELQAVRQLVAQRFSTNPAHQLLKARFLSLFTLPALLATVQPISRKKPTCPTNQEEEEEEEEEDYFTSTTRCVQGPRCVQERWLQCCTKTCFEVAACKCFCFCKIIS